MQTTHSYIWNKNKTNKQKYLKNTKQRWGEEAKAEPEPQDAGRQIALISMALQSVSSAAV